MVKIKITVIKRFSPEDVFGQEFKTPSGKVVTKCPVLKEGQEWIVDENGGKPKGLCGDAWFDLFKDVAFLRFGGNIPDWPEPGVLYVACSDGVRPVCFKLERLES